MSLISQDNFSFQGYLLDKGRWQLTFRGEPIPLSRKTFDLLLYLIEHRDRVAHKEELLKDLWPHQVVEESNLTQQVFMLRKALSRHGSEKIIETVAGRGYRFVAALEESVVIFRDRSSVTRLTVDEEVVVEDEPDAGSTPRASSAPKPRWFILGAGVAAAALGAFGIYAWTLHDRPGAGDAVEVVLADFQGFGDAALDRALNDALRIDLGQSPYVSVLSRSLVAQTLRNMNLPDDTAVDGTVSEEVCERNSAQVVLQGNLSQFGKRYLVSLTANSCVPDQKSPSGPQVLKSLAVGKLIVGRPDDLPHAVETLASAMRRDLGESRVSIRRFDKPLLAVRTGSLDALKAFSEGTRLGNQGDFAGALALFQHAVELDPNFGAVYTAIVTVYYNLQDKEKERAAILAAYAHRDVMTERQRLNITEFYDETVTGDISQAIETYKTEAALFPNSSVAFVNLAADYTTIGKPDLAIAPAARGVQLAPTSPSYNTLIAAQIQAGKPREAQQTAELALRHGIDNDDMHHGLLHSFYAQQRLDAVANQLDWGRHHGDAMKVHLDEVLLSLIRGRRREGHSLLESYHAGDPSSAFVGESEGVVAETARFLSEVGLAGEGEALLKEFGASTEYKSALIALSQSGAASRMDATLQPLEADHGTDYVWKYDTLPEVRAALLLSRHQPQAALTALEPARQFDAISFGPAYLRGRAYLDLGRPQPAAEEFKKITSRIYADTLSPLYPLAMLELARADAAANDPDESRAEYERFLASWSEADPDIPLYVAAKAEYAKLLATRPSAPASPHVPAQPG